MKYKKGSFVVIPNKEQLKGKPSEMQAIYLWICDHSDDNGECFPSRSRIAKEAGCGIRTVDKYLKQLVLDGFLEIEQRRKKGSKENTSNLYQLMIINALPSVKKDTTPSVEKDAVTISSINSTNITDIQEEIIENKVTLPRMKLDGSSSGRDASDRLIYLYGKLYKQVYDTTYKADFGRDKKIFNQILTQYSEIQVSYMLCVYFNWHGMTGNNSQDYNFVTGATFPITMFKTMINKFEVYARNIMSAPFDDDSKLLDKVIEIVSE